MDGALTINDQVANGAKGNITRVINAYSKRLLGFIRKRVASEADAEDILQDVFFQFIGNAEPVEQAASWLFTVARNKIIDGKRKHKPELIEDVYASASDEDENFEWTELLFNKDDNPETEYLKTMFWEALYQALDELPPEQKQVFVWHELEGISFKEMAAETGETVNTLISRKRYAVLYLRQKLQVLRDELLNY